MSTPRTPEIAKRTRTQANLSQRQIAAETGIPQPCISRFETGEGKLSPENYATLRQYIATLSPAPHLPFEKNGSENGTGEPTAVTENFIDDALIDATTNQVIEKLIENIENTGEQHVKTVKIPTTAFFTGESTIAEMETILATAENKLTGEVAFTLRDILEDAKISDN